MEGAAGRCGGEVVIVIQFYKAKTLYKVLGLHIKIF
jgi:hypothetical protein